MHLLPSNSVSILKSVHSNCRPVSVVITDGVPNTATHLEMKALATVSADMSGIGIASGSTPIDFSSSPAAGKAMMKYLSSGYDVYGSCMAVV